MQMTPTKVTLEGTQRHRQSRVARAVVIATADLVAGRARDRLELDVAHCPGCGQRHRHRAGLDFDEGQRRAPCGCRYVVCAAFARRAAA